MVPQCSGTMYGSNSGANGRETDTSATVPKEDVFAAKGVKNRAPYPERSKAI